jgi:hypothetical protein
MKHQLQVLYKMRCEGAYNGESEESSVGRDSAVVYGEAE